MTSNADIIWQNLPLPIVQRLLFSSTLCPLAMPVKKQAQLVMKPIQNPQIPRFICEDHLKSRIKLPLEGLNDLPVLEGVTSLKY